MIPKTTRIESKHIRNAARGEPCTLNLIGVCNGNPETTVLAHLPDESHGMGRKSNDISAAFCCSACHNCIDGRTKWPHGNAGPREWYYRRAMVRTWRRLVDKGVITIKGQKL